jgi:hypothetical protein
MTNVDKIALARAGAEALRRGDARAARDSFEPLVAAGQADASACIGLAMACRRLEDPKAAHAAVDRALALEPANLRALILKADHLAEEGDARAAASFYMRAAKLSPPAHELPADLRGEVGRAQAKFQQYAEQVETFLRDRFAGAGFAKGSSQRFAQSLELLFGRRQIYFQQPRYYYFPELPQIQFYERNRFPWLDKVEAATDAIRAELLEVLEDESAFKPYVQGDPKRPRKGQGGMLDNPDWSAFYLWKNGEAVERNTARCPNTLAALEEVPLPRVTGRSPSILFSLMRPGAHIPAHNGFVNTRLICHLPILVPGHCLFRVGNEVREWSEGKAWVFDDTIEHEAWNRSNRTRVVLLFEIWRPELTEEERDLVRDMFQAIDAMGGEDTAWGI